MSDDPAVRAAIEAGPEHQLVNINMRGVEKPYRCFCGDHFVTVEAHAEHVVVMRVEAVRPIIWAEALRTTADDAQQFPPEFADWLRELADPYIGPLSDKSRDAIDALLAKHDLGTVPLGPRAAVRTEPENG